jgi:hypothetical protein
VIAAVAVFVGGSAMEKRGQGVVTAAQAVEGASSTNAR